MTKKNDQKRQQLSNNKNGIEKMTNTEKRQKRTATLGKRNKQK